jgi:hypothetical protein
MAVRCPHCKREFDVTLFEFNRGITCDCGEIVSLQHREGIDDLIDIHREEEKRISEIRKCADRIAFLIVSTDYPVIDIEIEKQKFRDTLENLFPDKVHLYDLIYAPRFKRLEEQFREA